MRTIAMILSMSVCAFAQAQAERVQWSKTPEAFVGRQVEVTMRNAKRLKGEWTQVTPTTFTMVQNGKGSSAFSRADIETVKVSKRRIRGRVIGSIGGYYSGAMIALAATRQADGLQSGWAGIAIGMGVAGYYLGKSLDRDTREVVLLPD